MDHIIIKNKSHLKAHRLLVDGYTWLILGGGSALLVMCRWEGNYGRPVWGQRTLDNVFLGLANSPSDAPTMYESLVKSMEQCQGMLVGFKEVADAFLVAGMVGENESGFTDIFKDPQSERLAARLDALEKIIKGVV